MESGLRCWRIVTKELVQLVQDRYSLCLLLALPLVLVAILGMTTGELFVAHDDSRKLKLDVVDLSSGEFSQPVFRDLSSVGNLKLERINNLPEARSRLLEGKASLLLIIGADFDDRVDELRISDLLEPQSGRLARGLSAVDINLECSSAMLQSGELARYVVMAAVMRSIMPSVARKNRVVATFLDRRAEHRNDATESTPVGGASTQNGELAATPAKNPMYQMLLPAYTVMFTFFIVNVMSMSYITERQLGTMRRLQLAPISPTVILAGKMIPFLVISVLQSLILFAAGKVMFQMSWGSQPAWLLPVILCTSLAATGLGLLLSTVVETESQVASYNSFLIVTMGGISGCFLPRDWLPEFMQRFSLITPQAWSLIAYRELLGSATPQWAIVTRCCAALIGFAVVFFAAGLVRFRKLG